MFQLDPRSIIFVNFAYSGAISIYLLVFGYRSRRKLQGLNWWAYGFCLITLNFLLLSFRNLLPIIFTNIVPHFLAVVGFFLIKHGLALFFRKKTVYWPDILLLAVSLTGFIIVSDGNLHQRFSVLIGSAVGAYILTLLMIRSLRDIRTLKLLYILALIAQLARLWIGLLIPADINPMDAGTKLAVISMLFFLSQMMIALALISITVKYLLLEREVLLEKEREISLYDELTGLMNRRGFKTVYRVEEKRIIRQRLPMSLIMTDIDHFKAVNDRYGHECGDLVLKDLAEIMKKEFRGGDLLARWGGEEFIIVQPETNEDECLISLERTRKAIASHIIKYEKVSFSVTMSFGANTVLAGGLSFDEIMKRADDNLHKAKKQGRNRIVGNTSS
jgi:diguanylate cyclase (GGDEF)-like protein